jgi:cation diffusion facilitator CzcD-associated flavoprotein CzcO
MQRGTKPTTDYDPDERDKVMQRQWEHGGHGFVAMFTDQGRDEAANKIVADFVRSRIRTIVKNPEVAEALCPFDHPIGTRRLVLDTGYYETFNRANVTLVNLREEPIETFYESGLRTAARDYELDLIVFATGFEAFVGALNEIDIRNEKGAAPTDTWGRGPRTYLGIMTEDFPNLFVLTGPGSPSVLANMTLMNEYHIDWVADLIAHMDKIGAESVVPTVDAVDAWTRHVAEVAAPMLRQRVKNYMSHVNADGSQVFIPYIGGFGEYKRRADAIADSGYPGFRLAVTGKVAACAPVAPPATREVDLLADGRIHIS